MHYNRTRKQRNQEHEAMMAAIKEKEHVGMSETVCGRLCEDWCPLPKNHAGPCGFRLSGSGASASQPSEHVRNNPRGFAEYNTIMRQNAPAMPSQADGASEGLRERIAKAHYEMSSTGDEPSWEQYWEKLSEKQRKWELEDIESLYQLFQSELSPLREFLDDFLKRYDNHNILRCKCCFAMTGPVVDPSEGNEPHAPDCLFVKGRELSAALDRMGQ